MLLVKGMVFKQFSPREGTGGGGRYRNQRVLV